MKRVGFVVIYLLSVLQSGCGGHDSIQGGVSPEGATMRLTIQFPPRPAVSATTISTLADTVEVKIYRVRSLADTSETASNQIDDVKITRPTTSDTITTTLTVPLTPLFLVGSAFAAATPTVLLDQGKMNIQLNPGSSNSVPLSLRPPSISIYAALDVIANGSVYGITGGAELWSLASMTGQNEASLSNLALASTSRDGAYACGIASSGSTNLTDDLYVVNLATGARSLVYQASSGSEIDEVRVVGRRVFFLVNENSTFDFKSCAVDGTGLITLLSNPKLYLSLEGNIQSNWEETILLFKSSDDYVSVFDLTTNTLSTVPGTQQQLNSIEGVGGAGGYVYVSNGYTISRVKNGVATQVCQLPDGYGMNGMDVDLNGNIYASLIHNFVANQPRQEGLWEWSGGQWNELFQNDALDEYGQISVYAGF